MRQWNGSDRLPVAILIDVDGTLAGVYRNGRRSLRPSAPEALKLLSHHAPVFLWSIAGADNPRRLLQEFPCLRRYVSGCYGKDDFPLDLVNHPFCIDDEALDEQVTQSDHVILPDSFHGGEDTGSLMEAASMIVTRLKSARDKNPRRLHGPIGST